MININIIFAQYACILAFPQVFQINVATAFVSNVWDYGQKRKNPAHYAEKIFREFLGADVTRINIFKYYKSFNKTLLKN